MSNELTTSNADAFAVTRNEGAAGFLQQAFDQGIGAFNLSRIKVPAGGGLAWTVPTLQGDEAMKHIDCVIAYVRGRQRAWYHQDADEGGGNMPPSCASTDGLVGVGNNTLDQERESTGRHDCAVCRWNGWGSSRKGGGGKDCKEFAQVFLFRQETHLPTMLLVPPTSLKNLQSYTMKLLEAGRPINSVVTRLGLSAEKSAMGKTYSKIEFSYVAALDGEQLGRMREVESILRDALSLTSTEIVAAPSDFGG